jgi:hypothetical protein
VQKPADAIDKFTARRRRRGLQTDKRHPEGKYIPWVGPETLDISAAYGGRLMRKDVALASRRNVGFRMLSNNVSDPSSDRLRLPLSTGCDGWLVGLRRRVARHISKLIVGRIARRIPGRIARQLVHQLLWRTACRIAGRIARPLASSFCSSAVCPTTRPTIARGVAPWLALPIAPLVACWISQSLAQRIPPRRV